MEIDDHDLTERVASRRGRRAFVRLHAKYHSRVKNFIAQNIECPCDVEDVAQNVFLELWKSTSRCQVNESVEAYLFGVSRNCIRRYWRSRARRVRTVPIDLACGIAKDLCIQDDHNQPGKASAQQLRKVFEDIVAELPPKAQAAARLRYIDGLPSRKAARRAGCSLPAFWRRLQRVRKALQGLVRKRRLPSDSNREFDI